MRPSGAIPLLLAALIGCGGPPSITYGPSRESSTWIELPDGSKVAVDRALEWKGVRVYLSLLHNLVAVDGAAGKTLWAHWVSVFYDRVSILEDAGETWVELTSTRQEGSERYRLKTGEKVAPGEVLRGRSLAPLKQWGGRWSKVGRPLAMTVSTAENWTRVRAALFDGLPEAPTFDPVDFDRDFLLVFSDGDGWNCAGIGAEAWDEGGDLRVRLRHSTFQTVGGAVDARAFGVFVLPRSSAKSILIQRNAQRYIGGPPIWKDEARLPLPSDPLRELDPLR